MEGKLYSLNGCMGGEFINLRVDNEHMFVRTRDIQSLIYDIKDHSVAISVTTLDIGTYHMGCELSDVHALLRAISQLNDSNPPAMCLTMRTNTMAIPELPPQILKAIDESLKKLEPAPKPEPRFNGKAFAEFLRFRNVLCGSQYADEYIAQVEEWKYIHAMAHYDKLSLKYIPRELFMSGAFNSRSTFPDIGAFYDRIKPRGSSDTIGCDWRDRCTSGEIYKMHVADIVAKLKDDGCEDIARDVENGKLLMTYPLNEN